jgi:hypothetical protein
MILACVLAVIGTAAFGQEEFDAVSRRLLSAPASSTRADCDAELARAARANAFDLFHGSAVCHVAGEEPEASFLLLAGQIRAMPDMGSMMPVSQKDAEASTALYSFIYSVAGGLGDEEVLREETSRKRLFALLDQWKPTYDANYDPGWEARDRPDPNEYRAALAESISVRRAAVEKMARLYSDDIYYALHREEQELLAKQEGRAVDVNSKDAKELGDLASKMNRRAADLGFGDIVQPVPPAEIDPPEPGVGVPQDFPEDDEQVINGENDAVAKQCARGAQFSATFSNSRIARVLITRSDKWGTVWRADLEGGEFGPERVVCSSNYSSSHAFGMGTEDQFVPLTVPPASAR